MTPDEITALAAACERAADDMMLHLHVGEAEMCKCKPCTRRNRDFAQLRAHARALRDGRVIVTPLP